MHVTSSPPIPRSNGHAERSVQTVRNILRKSEDPLLIYRSTPLPWCKLSSAEFLMGRRLRTTNLPLLPEQLKPKWKEFRIQDDRKKNGKINYDMRHQTHSLSQIPDDTAIWITDKKHQPTLGRVIEHLAPTLSLLKKVDS